MPIATDPTATLDQITVEVRIRRLSPLAILPQYQSNGAAGMDLHAAIAQPLELPPGEIALLPCGFSIAVPTGFEAQIRPRSGLATKFGISVPNAPGTIDSDYRGEVKVALVNLGRRPFLVEPAARIAQMVIAPVVRCVIIEADELERTSRGDGGFGSTGV